MPEAQDLLGVERGAIVAPAGHGKTELIVKVAALGQRTLVLTHTNAGIQAIRARLKRMRIPRSAVVVDTIAGWCLRYAHAFPGVAEPPTDMPAGAQWDDVHRGVRSALSVPAIRRVVEASYDRILIDEYQDCNSHQHELAIALSGIAPTLIFGDPMQGIFEFAGATLNWEREIHPAFPLVDKLGVPYRWRDKNPALGDWIADARSRLSRGDRVEFTGGPVAYRHADDAFDMGALFQSLEGKEGMVAAIHCGKGVCYGLAAAARGGYQAIEEMAAKTMTQFASRWDASASLEDRRDTLRWLFTESFSMRKLDDGETPSAEEAQLLEAIKAPMAALAVDGPKAALEVLLLTRRLPRARLHRQELVRDVERAISEHAAGRCATMLEAAKRVRDRAGVVGRRLPKRTVSTPLLLKGLEFDHVVVPDATHFANESKAQAKLFYVAISRSTHSLTVTGPQAFLQLPPPAL
ncbi:MAG TPA: UvrD-helicase domain-containing protein [Albitalea sp.]|uniref:UvrD-helicase domain-containing protein n=1 Tax=Piscinibacter sp. TaxID=1903157 RepID=UPI002ED6A39B